MTLSENDRYHYVTHRPIVYSEGQRVLLKMKVTTFILGYYLAFFDHFVTILSSALLTEGT